jgi:hypothetical protein
VVEDACREVREVVTKAHETLLKWDEVAELEWADTIAHEEFCMLDQALAGTFRVGDERLLRRP